MVGKHRGHHGFLGFVVEHHGEAAEEHADERNDPRNMESAHVPPKDARKLREKPTRGTEAPAALARLVDLGVGARGEGFEVAAQLRLGGKGGDAPEVGGDLLVEQVKALRLVEGELAIGLSLEPVEGRLQLRPRRALGGDEAREVDDHERKMTRDGQMKPAARMSSGRARA